LTADADDFTLFRTFPKYLRHNKTEGDVELMNEPAACSVSSLVAREAFSSDQRRRLASPAPRATEFTKALSGLYAFPMSKGVQCWQT
jgi:hypothetical protein